MDRETINRAMNQGAKRLALEVRPTEPGSWTRLVAVATSRRFEGEELVALLSVAYEISHDDGESEREMYPNDVPRDEQGRELLCPECGGPWAEGYPEDVLHGR